MMIRATLLLSLGVASYAADMGWQPVAGYVLDSRTGTVRPIIGLPGASLLGSPITLPFVAGQLQVCAQKDFALAIESNSNQLWMVRGLRGGNSNATPMAGSQADTIQLNASGTAALLYSQASSSVQFLTGLPDQPSISSPVSFAGTAGTMAAMALSSDGSTAVIGFSDPAAGGIYLLTAGASSPIPITTAVQPLAMALFNGDRDLLVADAGADQVFLVRSLQSSMARQLLLSAADGLQRPVAVRMTGHRNIFVADAGTNALFQMDLENGSLAGQLQMSGTPSRIEALALPNVFALTEVSTGQLLLLDASQQPTILFVPRN
jgi:hypothetical protein